MKRKLDAAAVTRASSASAKAEKRLSLVAGSDVETVLAKAQHTVHAGERELCRRSNNEDVAHETVSMHFAVSAACLASIESAMRTAERGGGIKKVVEDGGTMVCAHDIHRCSKSEIAEMLALAERNTKKLYRLGGWGWSRREKRAELESSRARLFLVRRSDVFPYLKHKTPQRTFEIDFLRTSTHPRSERDIVAFVHYRFLKEDGRAVAYVYDVHCDECVQNCGLGTMLMERVHRVAREAGMSATMLTVFHANKGAMRLYTSKLGYRIDPYSPSANGARGCTYEILSRPNDAAESEDNQRS